MRSLLVALGMALAFSSGSAASAQTDADAWAVADRLLQSLGGRAAWASARSLYVRERAFPASIDGSVVAEFWRDLESPAYRSLVVGPSIRRETAWSENGGYSIRDGVRTEMSAESLRAWIADWRQEPYVMYHKLAVRDPSLRLTAVDENRLEIYDRESGSLLCWFVVDISGALLRWGNYYKGEVSEHVYGPLQDFGEIRMPSWGTSTTGSWRFEYEEVRPMSEPLDIEQ